MSTKSSTDSDGGRRHGTRRCEAFTANDKYLNGMCVFRKGNVIGRFANLPEGRDGIAETEKLAANIR